MTPTDPIEPAIADLVSADPDFQSRIREISNQVLDGIEETLEYGSPEAKAVIEAKYFPQMIKALTKEDGEDEKIERMKKEYHEMMGEMVSDE